ncbi:hypothetical protein B484DRAFT_405860 [Ochromonadaceae sp. CCMP2298]|nr:hypothetical protein B484DRAFT_405860 [Ochromonadaceae sp. CCMP2298]
MLPSALKFDTKVESMRSRTYKSNIAPQNGQGPYSCDRNEVIVINVPTGGANVLVPQESAVKFTMVATNGGDEGQVLLPRVGAHGAIRSIAVYSGSNLLENITQYGALARIMMDSHTSPGSLMTKDSIMLGTFTLLQGEVVRSPGATNMAANGVSRRTYVVPLFSIMGVLHGPKYFPLYAASASPIRIEITLASPREFLHMAENIASVEVTDVEYIATIIELGDPALAQLPSSEVSYHSLGVRNYQSSASLGAGSTTTVSFPIAAKVSSLKSLFVTPSVASDNSANNRYTYSGAQDDTGILHGTAKGIWCAL